jgi:hypothetical protein
MWFKTWRQISSEPGGRSGGVWRDVAPLESDRAERVWKS